MSKFSGLDDSHPVIYKLNQSPAHNAAGLVQAYPQSDDQLWDVLYRTFARQGLAITSRLNPATLRFWLERFAQVFVHPDADEEGTTHIRPRGDVLGGFSSGELRLHTDRAMIRRPPEILVFTVEEAAAVGGESLFADAVVVVRRLHERGYSLAELAKIRIMGSRPEESVPFIEQVACKGWIMRYRDDHVAGPYSPIPGLVDDLKAAIHEATFAVPLESGMGYLLNNTRWLHGRREFCGSRRASRMLFMANSHDFPKPTHLEF